jgi:F-type H+-transporting ATPase subunit b
MFMFTPNATLLVFVAMFLLFMVALKAMVLNPIGTTLELRRKRIADDIQAGLEARAKADEIVGEYQKSLHDARLQGQAISAEVQTKAQKARDAELKQVIDAGHAKLQEAKKGIAAERTALIDQIAEEEKVLVTTIIKKLLGDGASVVVDADKARQVLLEEAS